MSGVAGTDVISMSPTVPVTPPFTVSLKYAPVEPAAAHAVPPKSAIEATSVKTRVLFLIFIIFGLLLVKLLGLSSVTSVGFAIRSPRVGRP
jgi:hypothetical protein